MPSFLAIRPKLVLLLAAAIVIAALCPLAAQESNSPPASGPDPQTVISFLNQTIVWYRQLTLQQQVASEPSDVVFLNDNRQIADQVVRVSFDFARAEAQLLANQPSTGTSAADQDQAGSRYQSLVNMASKAEQQIQQTQSELNSLRAQLAT